MILARIKLHASTLQPKRRALMMRNSSVTSRGPELGSFSLPGLQQRRELQKPTFSTKTYLQHPLKVRPAVGRNAVGLGYFSGAIEL